MYFILRLTQLIVRPDSRLGLLRYKIAPKCLLPGPFGHSGVDGNPWVVGTVRSYNLVFTYPCQPSHRGYTRPLRSASENQQPIHQGARHRHRSPSPGHQRLPPNPHRGGASPEYDGAPQFPRPPAGAAPEVINPIPLREAIHPQRRDQPEQRSSHQPRPQLEIATAKPS